METRRDLAAWAACGQGRARRARTLRPVMVALAMVALAGCGSGDAGGSASGQTRIPPYVVQKGCEFTLQISEENSTSTTIEKGNTMVTLTLSMGDYAVSVSDCRVVDNPASLPVFKD